MKEFAKLKDLLNKMDYILSLRQKQYAIIIFVMGMVAALLELIGVAIILPILDVLLER